MSKKKIQYQVMKSIEVNQFLADLREKDPKAAAELQQALLRLAQNPFEHGNEIFTCWNDHVETETSLCLGKTVEQVEVWNGASLFNGLDIDLHCDGVTLGLHGCAKEVLTFLQDKVDCPLTIQSIDFKDQLFQIGLTETGSVLHTISVKAVSVEIPRPPPNDDSFGISDTPRL